MLILSEAFGANWKLHSGLENIVPDATEDIYIITVYAYISSISKQWHHTETVGYPAQREIPHTSHKRTFASLISVYKLATPPNKEKVSQKAAVLMTPKYTGNLKL
jgi:hypothetical protein